MKELKCLGCYRPLESALTGNYHPTCSKKLFGTVAPPEIDFGTARLEELALKSLSQHLGITGVQPKISVHVGKAQNDPKHRLMIVDLWGNFILKPPTKQFPDMSIVEDATMHMAEACGLAVAKHGLIKLQSGELAYITKRFDRLKKGKKVPVEDFCQLSELLTESKYNMSTEKAGRIILKHSTNSGLDVIAFFDLILFSFVTGNSDMHLKNFSLMKNEANEIVLAPFYDLLATKLLLADDKEEMALTINGKKARLKKDDFIALAKNLQILEKVIRKSFERMIKHVPAMKKVIEDSFLSSELKEAYSELIDKRIRILE